MEKPSFTIALIGNPNSGKTTLFNSLTGSNQRVGNWPGVTVEKKTGVFSVDDKLVNLVDLPGTYSMINSSSSQRIDEQITSKYIFSKTADLIINVVDSLNLERNLYLTTQLVELNLPMIIILNKYDLARKKAQSIDIEKLSELFNCPVIAISSHSKQDINFLKDNIFHKDIKTKADIVYSPIICNALDELHQLTNQANLHGLVLLEEDNYSLSLLDDRTKQVLNQELKNIEDSSEESADILIADSRYSFVHNVVAKCLSTGDKSRSKFTNKIDNIVLNRFLGLPIFFAMMYIMFLFSVNIGGIFQDFFDLASDAIFVQGFAHLLHNLHFPVTLIAILAFGIGKGINTTLTFIPVIGAMFLFLSFFESVGYMSRAAFVMDRFMRVLGLPGKSFVPLIVGFGCNVPAIMATRTLDQQRDRTLTIMMNPFMSCSARLAIFAVFVAAFFPRGGQNVVFALYMIGIIAAILTGFLLKKTILQGQESPFVMELPNYQLPNFNSVYLQAMSRIKHFVVKAGKVIIPVCVLIGALNSLTIHGGLSFNDGSHSSLLSLIGQMLTPIFAPIGIENNNWPATVGLLTGTLAKEVVIATLNTLYSQMGNLTQIGVGDFNLWLSLKLALFSIIDNFKSLPEAIANPVLASAPVSEMTKSSYGVMYQQFGSSSSAFAYLLFVLLYVPCVSTMAVISQELNHRWMSFSVLWSTFLAYSIAVLYYQAVTFNLHPQSSISWMIGVSVIYLIIIFVMKNLGQRHAFTT